MLLYFNSDSNLVNIKYTHIAAPTHTKISNSVIYLEYAFKEQSFNRLGVSLYEAIFLCLTFLTSCLIPPLFLKIKLTISNH